MFGLSTELITKGKTGHRKEIRVLTFRALALRLVGCLCLYIEQ